LFALGLMSKPVLVTLPFAVLLLDWWPLKRVPLGARLLVEKIPFVALAGVSCGITILAHRALGSIDALSKLPWDTRLANALVSYVRYLGKTLWPSRLSVFYPYPAAWPLWEVAACVVLLLLITGVVLVTVRSRPWLFVGWFWFLGVLVPFIGLVQAGAQAMADRFMYVPILGTLMGMIWGLHGLVRGRRGQQAASLVAALTAIIACLAVTRQQLTYWKNSETLFQHALEVTEDNFIAHNNLGTALDKQGQVDKAIDQYQETLRLQPEFAEAHNNLGYALGRRGQLDAAITEHREAIRLKPSCIEAYNNLAMALLKKGQPDEAINECQEALRLRPDYPEAHNNLGIALVRKGRIDEAISHYRAAIRLKPDDADAHYNLGIALGRKGQIDGAISEFQAAVRLKPDNADAHTNLGVALGMQGQIAEAIRQLQEALRLKPDIVDARNNLARVLEMKNAPAPH
jgi:protein O-mannosyl-transferase